MNHFTALLLSACSWSAMTSSIQSDKSGDILKDIIKLWRVHSLPKGGQILSKKVTRSP